MGWLAVVLAYGDGSYDGDYVIEWFHNLRSARVWGLWRAEQCWDGVEGQPAWVWLHRV